MANKELTLKQKRFCEEYLIDLCATQAAIRAGYSVKSANDIGARLSAKVGIRAYLDTKLAEQSKRTGDNADRVVRELAKIAFLDPAKLINFESAKVLENVSSDDTAVISSVKIKVTPTEDGEIIEREIKLHDKVKALELLGKRFGLFTDKIEIDAPINVTIKKEYE